MIDLEHVSKEYKRGGPLALDDINLHVDDGEFVFLLGHSGAGKSTLLKLLLREELPSEGKVTVLGKDVASLHRHQVPYLRRQMGIIFQDFRLIPTMTVYENIAFAMHVTNVKRREISDRVEYMLELVHLEDKAKAYPDTLSGGEQQRVAVARALAHGPKLVIADEPTGNIDPELSLEMMELLERVSETDTNDTGMSVDEFIKNYTALVQAIQESYPYTDIIVNTVPPVPANHANYPHMDQTKIDDFNMALLSMCEQMGLKFLNSAEALKDANGYGREDYYQTGDIHLKPVGLKAMLSYLRTHAYQTDDRRPDTANIPTRAEYTPNPSSAVTAPSSSEAAGSSEEQGVLYQASYRVDKTGGTLSSGSDSGKTSLSYEVTSAAQSISVTAVPQDGYVFVKWSDGVTQKTRTDTNFKQNVDVTAVFAAASVHISSTGKAVLGDSYTFTAKLGGKHLTADSIRWYANGAEVPQAAGKTTVKVEIDPSMLNATFKVYAVASYNGCTVTSNVLNVTVSGVSSGSSSHSSGSSGSTSGSSSSGSTSSSGASSGTTSGASSGATSTSGSSSHSSSDSSSHSSSSSESTASPAGSASASNGTASSSHSTSSSHADSGESSSASHSSSSSESSSASSGSSHAASESNASKEAANEQSASTDSAS